jgi:pyrimidine operon attenuation protein / uracil phosphoribosyltransferase
MSEKIILNSNLIQLTIFRLAQQLIEQHSDFSNSVIIGIQPRGVWLANRLVAQLQQLLPNNKLMYGQLDVSYYRDDIKQDASIKSYPTSIEFSTENKNVILVDDVLYTGRTIRSAMDAVLAYGRPAKMELMVLIDRKFSRHVPIQADYVGKAIDSSIAQKVKVKWKEKEGSDEVALLN